MRKSVVYFSLLLVILLSQSKLNAVALSANSETKPTYYIAIDANSVQQVYQLLLNGDGEARQITIAESDVISFGVADDGLSIAYISDGTLWLQPIHTEEPEALASIEARQNFASPLFSQDGQFVAYSDRGLWLLDLSTRTTRKLLEDVPLTQAATNVRDYRIYSPEKFVLAADGSIKWLVVDVGVWEWNTAGLYNLATGELQIIEDVLYTDLLPLYGGGVLIYGNNALDGEPVLRMASDINDITTYEEVLSFSGLMENVTLFADQAVEIAPGTVRILGSMLGAAWDFPGVFYFDYELTQHELPVANTLAFPVSQTGAVDTGFMSPDGRLIPVYVNVTSTESGAMSGQLAVLDIVTGTEVASLPGTVSSFQWQP